MDLMGGNAISRTARHAARVAFAGEQLAALDPDLAAAFLTPAE
jgi:hypothetical protein